MLRLKITNKKQSIQIDHVSGPLELGREPVPSGDRIVIDDPHVSRLHVELEELPDRMVRVKNCSGSSPVYFADGSRLPMKGEGQYPLPLRLVIGTTQVEVITLVEGAADYSSPDSNPWQTIQQPRLPAATVNHEDLRLNRIGDSITPETLALWFETVISVQRSAAGSAEFYQETAQAMVDLVGLDRGMVLVRKPSPSGTEPDMWEVVASRATDQGAKAQFSRTVLRRLVAERRTFFRAAETTHHTGSLMGVEAVVVSPVFGPGGDVVGALYGLRTRGRRPGGPEISPFEAQLVQLLAAAVGSGLARQQREAEAARSKIQFEQFFSSQLANELQRDPALLDGRDREVTILFSDIRNFSVVSQRLGPAETCRLVGDVMDRLTTAIVNRSGVVVDYIGDGLLAMWNAPADQPDHARLACLAALDMIEQLPELNAQWQSALGSNIGVGIGLNTGMARVGNTGSRRRFKYGPLGHAVNLASRVEGATKHLGVPILVTGSTRERVGDEFATRRLCKAWLVGMNAPVDLYELHALTAEPEWADRRNAYEEALRLYENGQWAEACRSVYPLLSHGMGTYDIPSLTLVSRAVECLKTPPEEFSPVFEFRSK